MDWHSFFRKGVLPITTYEALTLMLAFGTLVFLISTRNK
ncbi:putative holin-like toxin [Litoribacterium kuwaitense]